MTIQEIQDLGVFPKGEIPDPLQVSFKDANGDAIDLSSGFTAKASIKNIEGTATGLGTGDLSAPDAVGLVTYTWVAADFATEGTYIIQLWVNSVGAGVRYASEAFYYAVEEAAPAPSF